MRKPAPMKRVESAVQPRLDSAYHFSQHSSQHSINSLRDSLAVKRAKKEVVYTKNQSGASLEIKNYIQSPLARATQFSIRSSEMERGPSDF